MGCWGWIICSVRSCSGCRLGAAGEFVAHVLLPKHITKNHTHIHTPKYTHVGITHVNAHSSARSRLATRDLSILRIMRIIHTAVWGHCLAEFLFKNIWYIQIYTLFLALSIFFFWHSSARRSLVSRDLSISFKTSNECVCVQWERCVCVCRKRERVCLERERAREKECLCFCCVSRSLLQ